MQNYNLIHKVKDISGDGHTGKLIMKFFDTEVGETSVEIAELEDADIILLKRGDTTYTETTGTPGDKQYTKVGDEFTFNTAFAAKEKLFAMYYMGTAEFDYTEPVSVPELKEYLRLEGFIDFGSSSSDIDFEQDDWLLSELITGARQYHEEVLCISIVPKQLKAIITNQAGEQTLPLGPVAGVISFKNKTGDDEDYTMTGEDICSPKCDKMVITYGAGYATVPKQLKLAILKQSAWNYVNRGDENAGVCEDALKTSEPFSRKPILL